MKRPVGFFLLAGFAAMLAALVVYATLRQREAEVQRAMVQSVQIVVAAQNLPLGAKVDSSSVKLVRWSRDSLPPGVYQNPDAVLGTIVKDSFVVNEPIVADKLYTGEKSAGVMPLLIPAGMRAISVPVDEVSDIAGFVLPHSHVDVLVAVTGQGADAQKPFSKVVLQNIEVLAVAQQVEGGKDTPQVVKVVTLLVTLEEAERLTLATHTGSLRLVMRNYNDDKIQMTRGVDMNDMLRAFSSRESSAPSITSQARLGEPAPIRRPTDKVEILRNGKTAESLSFIDLSMGAATGAGPAHRRRVIKTSAIHRHPAVARNEAPAADHEANTGASSAPEPAAAPAAPAAASSPGASAAALPDPSPAANATVFGPHSRTIDIP